MVGEITNVVGLFTTKHKASRTFIYNKIYTFNLSPNVNSLKIYLCCIGCNLHIP